MSEVVQQTFRNLRPNDQSRIMVLMADGKWYAGLYDHHDGYDGLVLFDNEDEMEVEEYPDFQWTYAQP